ncbi:class II fructose-bisphosphate aldolase [Qiania dongpingensis]|uniref:Class II fructose-bisphosphate aldolase n=1 Tax=Qiania dongpingensis TaxID=2763669 RepID=A0A7G9G282_9FIRM|nr:class II fructose-bisphosphate aldolase [Qiania dongpingensis]QNM04914.1 class II fructose-bisphosphate aldolase [Qiania dongpingensis]
MALSNYVELLNYAKEHKITIGAFNALNLEILQALVSAASRKDAPIIVQTYHKHVDFAGADYMRAIAEVASTHSKVKIAMGLDHGRSYEQAKLCIDAGYSGVMIDLASEDYDYNVKETCRVVEAAHARGISVEAELGTISDADRTPEEIALGYTDPEIARRFVKDTGIDCLAVSIGTAHGVYKYTPKINFDLLKELIDTVSCPIVVHGGSGTPDEDVTEMVRMGIAKLNVGTDFFIAYNEALYAFYKEHGARCDIADALETARTAVEKVAEQRLDILTQFRV